MPVKIGKCLFAGRVWAVTCLVYGILAQATEAQMASSSQGAAPKPLDSKIVEAWERAGVPISEPETPSDMLHILMSWSPGVLTQLPDLGRPFNLVFSEDELTDTGLKELTRFKSLKGLFLYKSQVTDAGLKELASLKGLEELSLADTAVTDAGLKELSALANLHYLDLSFTRVTGASMRDLIGLKNL